jgi:hypothetical protein
MVHRHRIGFVIASSILLAPAAASATPDWADLINFSGYATSDLRFDIDNYRGATPGQGYDFSTNRNDVDLRLEIKPHPRVIAVIDARARYYGFISSQTLDIASLWDASKTDPFNIFLDQAFVSVSGVPVKWIDLKAGRMQQTWGSADVFSPNDNLNSRDFSDPLDYTRKVPNEMVEIDAYPTSWLTINAVWVPIFQPSMLPPSAPLAFAIHDNAQGCLTSFPAPPLTHAQGQQLASLFSAVNPCSLNFQNPSVTTYLPNNGIADSQAAIRARFKVAGLDIGLNYYYGRFGFPVAYDASVHVTPTEGGKTNVQYAAEVTYPRLQVVGLDFNYSAPWLFDIGFVGEVAVIFPEEVDFALGGYNGSANLFTLTNVNVPRKPFVKGTFGADYTFTSWFYLNASYIHGFVDEFNDAYGLHDYIAVAPEFKVLHDTLQLRVATIWDLTGTIGSSESVVAPSNVVYPQLKWIVMPAVEATLGAFILGGPTNPKDPLNYASRSKFGQPAAGRSVAFLKVKVSW